MINELAALLPGDTENVSIQLSDNSLELDFGAMYDRVPLPDPQNIIAIKKFFGAETMSIEEYSVGGCETCDYGSIYGYVCYLYKPTKNLKKGSWEHCKGSWVPQ